MGYFTQFLDLFGVPAEHTEVDRLKAERDAAESSSKYWAGQCERLERQVEEAAAQLKKNKSLLEEAKQWMVEADAQQQELSYRQERTLKLEKRNVDVEKKLEKAVAQNKHVDRLLRHTQGGTSAERIARQHELLRDTIRRLRVRYEFSVKCIMPAGVRDYIGKTAELAATISRQIKKGRPLDPSLVDGMLEVIKVLNDRVRPLDAYSMAEVIEGKADHHLPTGPKGYGEGWDVPVLSKSDFEELFPDILGKMRVDEIQALPGTAEESPDFEEDGDN